MKLEGELNHSSGVLLLLRLFCVFPNFCLTNRISCGKLIIELSVTQLLVTKLSTKEADVLSTADKTIDPRILESAKEEFLSKPYQDVYLRDICRKAGVTTGALYKRYPNKEALFDALVEPTLAVVREFAGSTESFNYEQLDKNDMKRVWELSPETHKHIVNMIYDNYDGFRLLLCHAEGTKHAHFIHDFATFVTERCMVFMREVYERGASASLIDEEEFHMLMTAYWSTMFEPVIHGLSREKALAHSEIVARLFNWNEVLGF